MSLYFAPQLEAIISPCHERFGCTKRSVEKSECALGCAPLAAFNRWLDKIDSPSYGIANAADDGPTYLNLPLNGVAGVDPYGSLVAF